MATVNIKKFEPQLVQILTLPVGTHVLVGEREPDKQRNRLGIISGIGSPTSLIFLDRGDGVLIDQSTNLLVYVVARVDIDYALRP